MIPGIDIRPIRSRFVKTAALIILTGIAAGAYLIDPAGDLVPACLFHELTGYSCFSCGLTRSLHATAHLELQKAAAFHIMGPVLVISLTILLLKTAAEVVTGREIHVRIHPVVSGTALIMFAALWIGFWIVRFIGELS